jgi:hypothetical protein
MDPGDGAPGSTLLFLALAALLPWFGLTAALLATLVASALLATLVASALLAALAGLLIGLTRLLLTTLVWIVCLVHALLLWLHVNQTSRSIGMFPARISLSREFWEASYVERHTLGAPKGDVSLTENYR